MRFWLTHSGDVSLHEQIVRQVRMGVLCGELEPGERLPSTRAMARRFGIHANTVSTAYTQLCDEQWLERRHGSGVYVRLHGVGPDARVGGPGKDVSGVSVLESLLSRTVRVAREFGFTDAEVQQRFALALAEARPLLLLEPDVELARIVLHEARAAGCLAMEHTAMPTVEWAVHLRERVAGFLPVVLPSKAGAVREALGAEVSLIVLQIGSIAQPLAQRLPSTREHLVGIASRWPEFLRIGQTMLVAAGFSADALVVRDTREADWRVGLGELAGVVCDSLTATKLPGTVDAIVFSLLTERSLQDLGGRVRTAV
jgi:DNA-binding transcriptional regulator YhcF (GntR family)